MNPKWSSILVLLFHLVHFSNELISGESSWNCYQRYPLTMLSNVKEYKFTTMDMSQLSHVTIGGSQNDATPVVAYFSPDVSKRWQYTVEISPLIGAYSKVNTVKFPHADSIPTKILVLLQDDVSSYIVFVFISLIPIP